MDKVQDDEFQVYNLSNRVWQWQEIFLTYPEKEDRRQEEGQHLQGCQARPVINGEDGVIFMGF